MLFTIATNENTCTSPAKKSIIRMQCIHTVGYYLSHSLHTKDCSPGHTAIVGAEGQPIVQAPCTVSFVEPKKFLSEAENTVVDTGAVGDKREL